MKKLIIYSIVFARLIILLVGFVFLPLFFLLAIILQIANLYLSSLFTFAISTKTIISGYDNELNPKQ